MTKIYHPLEDGRIFEIRNRIGREPSDPKDGSGKLRRAVALCGAIFVAVLCVLFLSADPPRLSASPLGAPPPTLTAISPTEAYNYQATTVTIIGANFTATPTITLGIMPLADVMFVSSITLTATVPADLPGGSYTVTVTNPDGQSGSLADAFTVLRGGGTLGSWEATISMSTRRASFAAVATGGYLYVLGGYNTSGKLSSVEWAAINSDGSPGPWQFTTPMTSPREGFAAVAAGSYLYALGGHNDSGYLSSVERATINADGSLGSWQTMTSMTTVRAGFAAVVAGDYLYALGGVGPGALASVERAAINADGSLGPWQSMASMTTARFDFAAVHSGGHIYALGGRDDHNLIFSSVEQTAINADGSLDPWQSTTSMTTERKLLVAVVKVGYLYVLGGHKHSGTLSSVELAAINSDGSLGSWWATTPMTSPRRSFRAVAIDHYLYIIGGIVDEYFSSSVERAAILYNTVYLPLVLKDF